MSLVRKKVSQKLLAAVRSNGRKSRGPRTESGKRHSSLNAIQHGAFARVSPAHMKALGENFSDFAQLLASLREAFNPQDGYEEALVGDMAEIRWKLIRLDRAESGLLASRKQSFRIDREWKAHLARRARADAFQIPASAVKGEFNSPDCADKYYSILVSLKSVRNTLLREGFKKDYLKVLELIFGLDASCCANQLILTYLSCSKDFENQPPATQAFSTESFLKALQEEIKYFEREFELHLQREVEVTEEMSDAQMLPSVEELDRVLRYKGFYENLLERKLQQFWEWRREKATVILAGPLEIRTKAGDAYEEQIEQNTTRLLPGKNAKRNPGCSGRERQTSRRPVSPEPRQAYECRS
jgi:hypothetical protein